MGRTWHTELNYGALSISMRLHILFAASGDAIGNIYGYIEWNLPLGFTSGDASGEGGRDGRKEGKRGRVGLPPPSMYLCLCIFHGDSPHWRAIANRLSRIEHAALYFIVAVQHLS